MANAVEAMSASVVALDDTLVLPFDHSKDTLHLEAYSSLLEGMPGVTTAVAGLDIRRNRIQECVLDVRADTAESVEALPFHSLYLD